MTTVNEYAASEMRYICASPGPSIGYSQPFRTTLWTALDDAGYLTKSAEADCSAAVSICHNVALHNVLGTPYNRVGSHGMFPVSGATWTGTIPGLSAERGFTDIGDSWTGNAPDGGFQPGDWLMAPGHVSMAVKEADGSFLPQNPTIAELWIDAAGDIYGSAGRDGSAADDTGQESRLIRYGDHPFTRKASWTTCLRYTGQGSIAQSYGNINATPNSERTMLNGIDVSNWQAGINFGPINPDFVIVQVTRGTGSVNDYWHAQLDQAYQQGRPIGVYHYIEGGGAKAEAEHFYNTAKNWDGYVMWCVDWEKQSNSAWGDNNYLAQFIRRLRELTGEKWVMLYAASGSYPWALARQENCGRWVAQYATNNPKNWDYNPWNDGTWPLKSHIHQYTGTGRVAGYAGDLDLDLFDGTADDFKQYYTATDKPQTSQSDADVDDGNWYIKPTGVWNKKTDRRIREVFRLSSSAPWGHVVSAMQYALSWQVDAYALQKNIGVDQVPVNGKDDKLTRYAFLTWWNNSSVPAGSRVKIKGDRDWDAETITAMQHTLNHSWANGKGFAVKP